MKKVLFALILALSAASWAYAAQTDAPVFSLESGFYAENTALEILGDGDVFYTLNGDAPTRDSFLYTKPIMLEENLSSPRTIQGRVAQEQVPAATVIRAAKIDENGNMSSVANGVYFVGGNALEFYGLPVVNLTLDSYDLWGKIEGIYGNYEYEHNVGAYFHYWDKNGVLCADRQVEVKVSGHGSRSSAKKSIRIYFTKGDVSQGKYIDCNIIPGTEKNFTDPRQVTKFYKLTMRISDWSATNLKDVLAQKIGEYTRADTANSSPVALFLNGEFWGMYECREQYDKRYISTHYDIDDDDVVLLNRDWTLAPEHYTLENGTALTEKIEYSEGPEDENADGVLGQSYYMDQWLYIRSLAEQKDIAKDSVYEEFCSLVDVDNYIDYIITYIYSANDDWPGNNFKFWRVTEEKIDESKYGADGKWRFLIHDFDIAFEDANHNTLRLSALEKGEESDARHPEFATAMLGGLLKNQSFRSEFSQRLMAYLSTAVSEENIKDITDALIEERRYGKIRDLLRWDLGSGSSKDRLNYWLGCMNGLQDFARRRPEALQKQLTDILNAEPYNAQISTAARFDFSTENTWVSICGARITKELYPKKEKGFSTYQFVNVPVKIKAEDYLGGGAKITVIHNNKTQIFFNEAEFTVENGEYTVITEPVNE